MEQFDVGGVLATLEQINAAITKLEATGGTAIAQQMRTIGSPLASCDYHKVARDTRTAFPALIQPAGTKQKPTAHEKNAFVFALRVYAGHAQNLPAQQDASADGKPADPGSGPGHDLVAARRTTKKNYGENQAAAWGRTIPGAVLVEQVGDQVPKLGYDVKVTLADGTQIHIEAKASGGEGDLVAIEEGERAHNQDSACRHEHVLFVVPHVQAAKIDDEWECSGGDPVIIRNWKIATSDLILQPSWLYTVPAGTQA
jgi:hypothetical protein